MPRKYHRPPDTTTKRRKTRKSPIPYEFDAPPVDTAVDEGEGFDDGNEMPVAAPSVSRTATASAPAGRAERHVSVDYAYVRGEVVRIVAIMAFLVVALIITSIFR